MPEPEFDPDAKEQALASAAQAWDTTQIGTAAPGDVPTVDLTRIHTPEGFASAAERLGGACRTVGFFYLTGHSLPSELRRLALDEARRFHALPDTTKAALRMDLPGRPQGIGYLEVGHRKLPRRRQGNQNAAFIVKRDIDLSLADNLWPAEDDLPDFRRNIEHVAAALEQVALGLLPLFARALKMPRDFFAPAFEDPLYRLRLTRYPRQNEGYGIAPHVDTTFITLLLSTSPGLVIYQPRRREWIRVP
ncbi:MAG: 2-oxoglutarate and iron-dependent oxygenase domain-containing protein, partial [Pseudomonadota bacterium]